jgi:hypothetical protein
MLLQQELVHRVLLESLPQPPRELAMPEFVSSLD